uniref:NACHT domain-containing protein n=1 Tax=Anopheles arabiensis TaxID=7173 RepID=A0A182HXZ6_ANOAR
MVSKFSDQSKVRIVLDDAGGSVNNINKIRKQSDQMEKLLTISNGNVLLEVGKANTSPWAIEQMLQLRLFQEKLNAYQFTILFDGFDEIAPTYKEFVMAYLGKLASFNAIKELYISSRPYNFMDDLNKKKTSKNCAIYRLQPFLKEEKIKFMYNYLSCNSTVWKECNEIDRYQLLYVMYRQDMGCSMLIPILQQGVDLSQRTVK